MKTVNLSSFELPEWWHEEYKDNFSFVHVDYVDSQRIVYLVSDLFYGNIMDNDISWYEIGLYELETEEDFYDFYETFGYNVDNDKFYILDNSK